jgi:serine/threonine protein kinase
MVAVLSDFGLTAVMSQTSGFTTQTTVRGSIRWMAPELFTVDEVTDTEASRPTAVSDIFSLSMVYYEVSSYEGFFTIARV